MSDLLDYDLDHDLLSLSSEELRGKFNVPLRSTDQMVLERATGLTICCRNRRSRKRRRIDRKSRRKQLRRCAVRKRWDK